MAVVLEAEEFLKRAGTLPVIDVRSPGEYKYGHIPSAFNIPLFDDEERATVGTLYKNSGQETALAKGFSLAEPKKMHYLEELKRIGSGPEILVHCWRGGMRSGSMAAWFEESGFRPFLLNGGYKAYRRYIRERLASPNRIIVVGGYTGSGKTEILHGIAALGEQVLDLEAIARHKGSVFGGLGQLPQPTNEQFENEVYLIYDGFDTDRPIWIEDESRMIGSVTLPDPLVDKINRGLLIRIRCDREERVRRLVSEYSGFDPALLSAAILKISERLGGMRTSDALESIRSGHFTLAASTALDYYDKAYDHATERRSGQIRTEYILREGSPEHNATGVIQLSKEILEHGADIPGL
jgi:tRNA 2-selenouridine synthase